jgi:hypothetical protein
MKISIVLRSEESTIQKTNPIEMEKPYDLNATLNT